MIKTHSFHIPVMGLAFTIDTPLKVASYGIDSVISLGDDMLIEKMRKKYAREYGVGYVEITSSEEDFRAKRITAYLNLVNTIVEKKFARLSEDTLEGQSELRKLYNLLPDNSTIKEQVRRLEKVDLKDIEQVIKTYLRPGKIDVNIMTKVDKENYINKEKLPVIYNDAHAALRGFANSDLSSSIVLSAGLNPRLYSYIENFDDFYTNAIGEIKKKIILKVSDYRSGLIQGKFLAKKGLWVSEFRVESGLNCGGHAFATEGHLMGPILAEFRDKRNDMRDTLHEIFIQALEAKKRTIPQNKLTIKVTAQGGVGTAEEHQFLLDHYQLSSVGWGTPFLLVPEATTVDKETRDRLAKAKENDLYLSNISPLGIPFHNLRNNTKDREKRMRIEQEKPGSPCPKKFLSLNKEFTDKAICTASRQYQNLKIKELDEAGLDASTYSKQYASIVEKACICVGLGTSALLSHGLSTKVEGPGVSVCPGPNLAYFSKIISLKTMLDHIYGKGRDIAKANRPNFFIKELGMYIEVLKSKYEEAVSKHDRHLISFIDNLNEGIDYYENLIETMHDVFKETRSQMLVALQQNRQTINRMKVALTDDLTTA